MYPRYDEILSAIPEYDSLPTADALVASTDRLLASTDKVTTRTCGSSRSGRPIRCLDTGPGPLAMLVLAVPQPGEPLGALVIQELLRLIVETDLAERLGYRFHIIETGDPDGARVNERWYARHDDLAGYILNVHRPAIADQLEWAFPVSYKKYSYSGSLPEASAIRGVIDTTPLDCMMSLHNSAFSGVYYSVSDDDVAMREELMDSRLASGLPVHRGEPEAPFLKSLGDGIFRSFGIADEYDYLERWTRDPASGLSGGMGAEEYVKRAWDAYSTVARVPFFTSPRIADLKIAGISRGKAKLRGIATEERYCEWLRTRFAGIAAELTRESPWSRTVREYLATARADLTAERKQAEQASEFAKEATGAQMFDSHCLRELEALVMVGQFARMAEAEPRQSERLRSLVAEAEALVRARVAEISLTAEIVAPPLRTLVQLQLSALLHMADFVRAWYRPRTARPARARTL